MNIPVIRLVHAPHVLPKRPYRPKIITGPQPPVHMIVISRVKRSM